MNDQTKKDAEPVVLVNAELDEICETLRETLTAEEFRACSISWIDQSDEVRRGSMAEVGFVAVHFLATAYAGGLAWDLTKKVGAVLIKKYGEMHVVTTDKNQLPINISENPDKGPNAE